MSRIIDVTVPDIGDFQDIEVIEVLVSAGDTISAEDSLIVLESDKAAMEIPSLQGGTIKEMKLALGDMVSQGSLVLTLEVDNEIDATGEADEKPAPVAAAPKEPQPTPSAAPATPPQATNVTQAPAAPAPDDSLPFAPDTAAGEKRVHASPSVRHFARELGVSMGRVQGSGNKGRILKEDVQSYVKQALNRPSGAATGGAAIPATPIIDFSKFGDTELKPLSRINKISGKHLHACWLNIPHVTQFDECDITELEAFRVSLKADAEKRGLRLTPLIFIMKALVTTLQQFPTFNASLDPTGENLILKRYYNIGVAVDTPNGLMVPVIRDVDKKGLFELARELGEVSARAREGSLTRTDMEGGNFTISSLGGIGGTQFSPIVNSPEVAILGVSRSSMKPVWDGSEFKPRLMLPLALSYDHRVIDGAVGARFITTLNQLLNDIRKTLL
ncbi:MAG TPA: dihydrolipoyllysine-residue acetyltransferase [Ectothiorhodospiraceae bacterium]|nr:dihydrolipoyllysine-residue acetyltransferase [Ectothiorhodospiraceae bacterium]